MSKMQTYQDFESHYPSLYDNSDIYVGFDNERFSWIVSEHKDLHGFIIYVNALIYSLNDAVEQFRNQKYESKD